MFQTLIVAAGLAMLAGPGFAGDQGDPGQSCDGSTYEMVDCFKAKTAHWDKRLNAAYAKAGEAAQPKQRQQLRVAQRLWVQYRDANCLYWALGEGTIARIESSDCMFRMTKERAEELEGAADRN